MKARTSAPGTWKTMNICEFLEANEKTNKIKNND
jgi:hypothetical protein